MILKGNARGGAKDLALHLLKEENEHVELHELRGFVSDTLMGALNEAYCVSRGSRCTKFLYSLSLNPPQTENVPIKDFEAAIEKVEQKLGLADQPRAIVFHEKEGRRHAHCVWSRIDMREMKAVQLSYDRNQLKEISRDLFLEHGWKMPAGLSNTRNRDPRNFTLAEWQQAKRTGQNAKDIKSAIQDAWAMSDNRTSFIHTLEERGFKLARGDRRGFVAVDVHGEVYAIARQTGRKSKEIKARLGDPHDLPDVATAQKEFAREMQASLKTMQAQLKAKNERDSKEFETRRTRLVQQQRKERAALETKQKVRCLDEAKNRQARFRKGFAGIWDRLRCEHSRIRNLNEQEASKAILRDRAEKDGLIQKQLAERRHLSSFRLQLRETYNDLMLELDRDRKELKSSQPIYKAKHNQKPRGPEMC